MNQTQIEDLVVGFLKQAQSGASIENPKFDFKREWYNLDNPEGISAFICDTSAIANTVGLDGFIVIGYDDKANTFKSSPFSASGLPDPSNLLNLINKNADPIYTVNTYGITYEDHQLTVLHIPPSINKPHFIRSYIKSGRSEEQRVFVRKNSINHRANRSDIELMYYDRKNIQPDYLIKGSFHLNSFKLLGHTYPTYKSYTIHFPLTIENNGRRPISIAKISLLLNHSYAVEKQNDVHLQVQFNMDPVIILSNELKFIVMDNQYAFDLPVRKEDSQIFDSLRKYAKFLEVKGILTSSSGDNLFFGVTIGKD